ncbi:MAG TPA: hypothetical protein VJB89_00880 [Candidatus Nanoarchaeia archaeon]|nr:hypothetical protein [Candidatus Nanoarchaeia archaeon]
MYDILDENIPEEELKRADHLVYVSLKYTRTTDVMMNAIKRMIAAYELSITNYLIELKKQKKLNDVPFSKNERALLVSKLLGNKIKKHMSLYNILKRIEKSEYTGTEEFRKNVTLKTKGVKSIEVKMVNLYEFLDITKEFVKILNKENE